MNHFTKFAAVAVVLSAASSCAGAAHAQGFQAPPTTYGYQPYNDRNPTGFNHPNNTGYGHYVYSPAVTGHRSRSLSYRRFKGY